MIVLAGAAIVQAGGMMPRGTIVIGDGRILSVEEGDRPTPPGATRLDLDGHLVVPGFIDVHVHGVEGIDVLDGPGAVAAVAARLPRYGVTAFCPTSVACDPRVLGSFLGEVAALAGAPPGAGARVLPAHLESNFLNPAYRGAQPASCLRRPPAPGAVPRAAAGADDAFTGADILAVIDEWRAAVGIVTLAPELPGGLDLTRRLAAGGIRVSMGHTAATYDEARAAIAAGARHATHLFNRMPPLGHRAPGAAGAVLASELVAAEIICDGVHVHPSMIALAVSRLGVGRVLGITDGTAGSGLPAGSRARLGGQEIIVTTQAAELPDGTLAGSVLTMDGAFRVLVDAVGLDEPAAARVLSTTPAEQLGLADAGVIRAGARADLAVLDADRRVRQTFVAGRPALEH
ncbi:MAG: N-acetylglucosamine-6-phosphate deacetylase [Vicinamibacterales bacterium]